MLEPTMPPPMMTTSAEELTSISLAAGGRRNSTDFRTFQIGIISTRHET